MKEYGEITNTKNQLTKRSEELTESKQALTKLQQAFAKQQSKHQEELQAERRPLPCRPLVNENRMCVTCGFKADAYQQLSRYKRDCEHCVNARKKKRMHNAKVV